MNAPVLYISYDGMLEPLGQSQVLAYLEQLTRDREIHLLSYEKPEDWAHVGNREAMTRWIAAAGIRWHPRRYHKRPSALATAWDITAGILASLALVRRHRIGIVHARSYVPSVIALALKRLSGVRYVFDMRGFWADERVDGGLWTRNGWMYRIAKWFERRFLISADHVVSLTHAGVRELCRFSYLQGVSQSFTVIPTCADLGRFRPLDAARSGFVLGYVGSAGTWYLFDAVVACFARLRELRPEAQLLVINRGGHGYIRERLLAGGVPLDAVELRAEAHAEVPAQMARMHAGVFFIKPVFSKQASAPTKLGEFLGCGIPCLANVGVGDMAEILEGERVGVAVESFDSESVDTGLHRLLVLAGEQDIANRCRAVAQRHFSLEEGVARYRAIYRKLDATV